MAEIERHIEVEGGFNIRDLGGYPTGDGHLTRWHTLIRAGNLHQVTPAGQEQLLRYGVRTIIDLRDDVELSEQPDVFAQHPGVRYGNLPFSRDGFAANLDYARLDELYCQYLSTFQTNIGSIMAAIANAEPGILFHCAVGKDRTGMISALLLDLVSVPAEVIAEDYAQTTRHIAPLAAQWRENDLKNGQSIVNFERDIAADADIMLATLATLNSEYGGAARYLRICGVTDQQLARLRALLVEE